MGDCGCLDGQNCLGLKGLSRRALFPIERRPLAGGPLLVQVSEQQYSLLALHPCEI